MRLKLPGGLDVSPYRRCHSYAIPPTPTGVEAQFESDSPGLTVSFAWTAGQYAKDPYARRFKLYLDRRQVSPILGTIEHFSAVGEDRTVRIQPERADWDQGEELVGGMVQAEGTLFEIREEITRAPLELLLTKPPGFDEELPATIPAGTRCVVTSNWLDPDIWHTRPASVEFYPPLEAGSIQTTSVIDQVGDPPDATVLLKEVLLQAKPFAAPDIALNPDDGTVKADITAATLIQNGMEFTVWPPPEDPGNPDPDREHKFRLGPFVDEQGNPHWPVPGPVQVYPRIAVRLLDFEFVIEEDDGTRVLSDLFVFDPAEPGPEPQPGAQERFAVGVSASKEQEDVGTIEGPVSARVFCDWASPRKPATVAFAGVPAMESVQAERAGLNGYSSYVLKWDPIPGAHGYNVYRAPEKMVVEIDSENPDPCPCAGETLYERWQMAGHQGNERAFARLTAEPWEPVYDDEGKVAYQDHSLPGHSSSRFFYRIQAISETGVLGDLSPPLQPVHCPLARKPEKLAIHKCRLERQDEGTHACLYWRHIALLQLDYYVLYRTSDPNVAERMVWREFEHAIKVGKDAAVRPLAVEFGRVDLSSLPGGREGEPLGIFRRADFAELEEQLGGAPPDFATANANLTNHYADEAQLGRAKVNGPDGGGLADHEPVVCYYQDGGDVRFVRELAGEKMAVDLVDLPGAYYYCVAAVDTEGNISELSVPLKVRVG